MSRQIVIDTDVICAAGVLHVGDARPALCGRFLIAVRDNGHVAVLTSQMLEEWHVRASRFSSTWLTSMFARRQVMRSSPPDVDLTRAMSNAALTSNERRACEKDVHLISAAIATDKRVASLDETARELFRRLATVRDGRHISSIHWVNPEIVGESPIEWLEAGAPDEPGRWLGARL